MYFHFSRGKISIIGECMNNEEYLKKLQSIFPNLQFFRVENNTLILEYDGLFKMPLIHLNLSLINPNLFYLSPKEIFQVLYILELLYKNSLTEQEQAFIISFMNMYLSLNDFVKSHNSENEEMHVSSLGIPVLYSYEEAFTNNPASQIIQTMINNHDNEILSGKNKQPRLVRTNETMANFMPVEEDLNFIDYGKAGFTTLLLIGTAIASTIFYITSFIIGH